MNKSLFTVMLVVTSHYSFGQTNTFPLDNRVGIGTTAPLSLLHVSGTGSNINGGNAGRFGNQGLIIEALSGGRSSTIGAQLEFVLPSATTGLAPWGQARIITVAGNASHNNASGKMILGTRRSYNKLGTGSEWYYGDDLVIDGLGNIGIGTLSPAEKLSVKGKIRAQEIKVELAGWADFVFAEDYKLPSLEETEKHIKEKGHLPGIPSAQEVKINGIELGDMNAKLLQKIEELTLYLIEKDKEIKKLIKEVKILKEK